MAKKHKQLPDINAYLNRSMPAGWQSYFSARRAGRYWGLSIICPVCHDHPPKEVMPWQRWRWLSAHLAVYHGEHDGGTTV